MGESGDKGEQRREHYRVHYPECDRPAVKILGRDFEVEEIAERGIKVCAMKEAVEDFDETAFFTITFHDGEYYDLEGKLKRAEKGRFVLQLSKSIPYQRIVEEQRYLIKHYPGYRQSS